jgi:hypothetical protein
VAITRLNSFKLSALAVLAASSLLTACGGGGGGASSAAATGESPSVSVSAPATSVPASSSAAAAPAPTSSAESPPAAASTPADVSPAVEWSSADASTYFSQYSSPTAADTAALQTLANAGTQDLQPYVDACKTIVSDLASMNSQLSAGQWPSSSQSYIQQLVASASAEQKALKSCTSAKSMADVIAAIPGMQSSVMATTNAASAAAGSFG